MRELNSILKRNSQIIMKVLSFRLFLSAVITLGSLLVFHKLRIKVTLRLKFPVPKESAISLFYLQGPKYQYDSN
ncbi:hypothetical protein CS542_05160 [Pedobacter sp. IW39]|nr:hypothetical protein CS542_05160 [Pedobacter sp. IW39]